MIELHYGELCINNALHTNIKIVIDMLHLNIFLCNPAYQNERYHPYPTHTALSEPSLIQIILGDLFVDVKLCS